MSDWVSRLRQASFRGIPFGVLDDAGVVGRRVAVHEYPGRDQPFAEDMGRAARRFSVRGFLVEQSAIYGGGDVIAQRLALEVAAEASGPGTLVHPTKGRVSVQLLTCEVNERTEEGGYYELRFEFIEAGARAFPGVSVASGGLIGKLVDAVQTVAGGALTGPAATLLGATGLLDEVGAVQNFAQQATAVASDAGGVLGLGSSVAGQFGRYATLGGGGQIAGLTSAVQAVKGATGGTLATSAGSLVSLLTKSTDPGSAIRLADKLLGAG